jgi:hypothetical protein
MASRYSFTLSRSRGGNDRAQRWSCWRGAPANSRIVAVRFPSCLASVVLAVSVACASTQADPEHPLPEPPGDPRGVSSGALGEATEQLERAHTLAREGQNAEAATLAREALETRSLVYGNYSGEMAWTFVWVTDVYIRAGYLEDARRVALRARDVGQRAELPDVVRIANRRLDKIAHLQSR